MVYCSPGPQAQLQMPHKLGHPFLTRQSCLKERLLQQGSKMSSPQGTHGAQRAKPCRPSAQTLFMGAALSTQHPLEEGCLSSANTTRSFLPSGVVRQGDTASHRGSGARAMLTHLRPFGLHGYDGAAGMPPGLIPLRAHS